MSRRPDQSNQRDERKAEPGTGSEPATGAEPAGAQVSVARALVETLQARGVDMLLGNPGSEFIPMIEAYAELRELGRATPEARMVAHEAVGVHMAYGAYLMTGRAQALMVHTTVGTANASLALFNAARMNVPLLLLAGRTPTTERGRRGSRNKFIHWAQEVFDQGAMVRHAVKWDYELRDAAMLPEVIDRALAIAMSPPRGPVYLMLPRELLYAPIDAALVGAEPAVVAETEAAPDGAALAELLGALRAARRPLLLCKTVGHDPRDVAMLERVAERYRLPVICEDAHCVNMRADHPCFAGTSHAGALAEADLLLCLDVDVPWIPSREQPAADARVVHVGDTPLFAQIPFRGHRGEQMLRCGAAAFLRALDAAAADGTSAVVDAGLADARETWLAAQRQRGQRSRDASRERAAAALADDSGATLDGHAVGAAIAEVWDERMVLINELHLPPASLPTMAPGQYFRTGSASGLGWGLGVGLGIRAASPERTVITVVGDGAYLFGNPAVVAWQSAAQRLPLVVIVLDNSGMASFRRQVRAAYPDGAAVRAGEYVFTDLSPSLDFAALARACGGHGETVARAADLAGALRRGLDAVAQGRPALLHVKLGGQRPTLESRERDGDGAAQDSAAGESAARAGTADDEAGSQSDSAARDSAARDAAREQRRPARLTRDEVELLRQRGTPRSFAARESLFERGDSADGVFVISEGNVKIVQRAPQDDSDAKPSAARETVVRLAGAGDVVGHRSIFSRSSFRASAIALEPTRAVFVPKAEVLALIDAEPAFAVTLLRRLSEDLSSTEQQALFFHRFNVRERVCAVLLMLRRSHGVEQTDASWRLTLRLTRSELASMVAAAMENVVRVLGELRRSALIREEDGLIVIADVEGLRALLPFVPGAP